ncbi:MAG TPA: O-methyltransferase [Mucilaginibacter sp.]|jgi:caffeoyl-CoA O-methyltransferase|nr:O-methyltransferase [Mucilaginibacter sp.]
MDNEIFEKVDNYIAGLLGREDEVLRNTVFSMENADVPPIQVSANQGKFLQVLAKSVNAKKILELGTCCGYSTIWLARALPENGHLISLEYEPAYAEIAKQNIEAAGLENIVEIKIGKALDILPQIEAEGLGPFDMIFIDADKPPYAEYFEWALKLSRPRTIIVADNVIREGKILDENHEDEKVQGVQRLNKLLPEKKNITATIIQTVGHKYHDGMAICVVN